MRHRKVGAVMTGQVIRAARQTPFKEVARLLTEHRISGLPVVDEDEQVIGVISETDLMQRQARQAEDHELPRRRWPRLSRRSRASAAKAVARTAGQLMSQPAVTIRAHDSIVQAARVMSERQVKRLPVVDEEGRLVGVVSRSDLVRVFLRPDEEIRQEVIDEVLVRTLWLSPQTIDVSVRGGAVTLTGRLERRSEVPIALRMAGRVDGVVSVADGLSYRTDDSGKSPAEQVPYGITENWIRKL